MDDEVTITLELAAAPWPGLRLGRWANHWALEVRKHTLCRLGVHRPEEHAKNVLGTAEYIWACLACGRIEGWLPGE